MIPTPEARVKRARTILRAIWQGYDAAGHSNGRSRTCAMLELAMRLIGPPDPAESRQADQGLDPLVAEAKDWMDDIDAADMEEQLRTFFEREAAEMGLPAAAERMAREIEDGFEHRMR